MDLNEKGKLKAKIKQLELLISKGFIPETTKKDLRKKLKNLQSQKQ